MSGNVVEGLEGNVDISVEVGLGPEPPVAGSSTQRFAPVPSDRGSYTETRYTLNVISASSWEGET
jgi:hypothetical protein